MPDRVSQQARNVSWELNQLGVPARFLTHDHDLKYSVGADLVFESEGIRVIKTPIRAPNANSHMEHQIGSTRRVCLDWILILNRRHLERLLSEWLEHYNQARPHRGLDLATSIARSDPVLAAGPVVCRESLGGLLRVSARACAGRRVDRVWFLRLSCGARVPHGLPQQGIESGDFDGADEFVCPSAYGNRPGPRCDRTLSAQHRAPTVSKSR